MLHWTRHLFGGGRPPQPTPPAPPVDDERPPRIGMVLGDRYHLDAVIGRGHAGLVFRAKDLVHDEDVAIKVLLRSDASGEARPAGDLAEEAAVALRLSHPNIVRVFELERAGAWPFLVMELVVGADLHRHAKGCPERRIRRAELVAMALGALDGLHHAHARGIFHNDVKPSNLLLTRAGAVKLCDFGLARVAEASPSAWLVASSAGAPAFMSPERIRGELTDARSDLYSLAATLYTLATGRPLFGVELAQAWRGHLELPVPPSPHVPPALFDVLRHALAKDPDDRFDSATSMRAAMLRAADELHDDSADRLPPDEPPLQAPPRTPPPIPRAAPPPPRVPTMWSTPVSPVRVPEGMVRVPPTRLTSSFGGEHELRPFFVMRAPVTNAQWKRFVDATGEATPQHWLGGRPPRLQDHEPVVGVSLAAARRYARWAGSRLPSDVEWEAARALGLLERTGVVWEWSEPDATVHATEPEAAWVFGGSPRRPPARDDERVPRASVAVEKDYLYLGFRCVRDVDAGGT